MGLIVGALKGARKQVDVAMAYLSHEDLINALCLIAQQPGMKVRFIADDEMATPSQRPILERMASAGIETYVVTVKSGKMHLKMAVIDDDVVISGTANWTQQSFDANIEDTVVMKSAGLAKKDREQMDRLIAEGTLILPPSGDEPQQGEKQFKALRWPEIEKSGGTSKGLMAPRSRPFGPPRFSQMSRPGTGGLDAWFTFEPGVVAALESAIRSATNRIDVGMYILNQPGLVQALVDQANVCNVRVLFDRQMQEAGFLGVLRDLASAGCEVGLYGADRKSLHMKTLIIDNRQVWTGSANWTKGAMGANIEDLLCFHSPEMAAYYRSFLDQVALHCEPYLLAKIGTNEPVTEGSRLLPPTGPRTNYSATARTGFNAFECEATVRYLPDEQYLSVLLDAIRNANQSLLALMYTFPAPETAADCQSAVVQELIRAAKRGVYVYLGLYTPPGGKDRLGAMHSEWAERLRTSGVDVRLSAPGAFQHDKLVVADMKRVLIGSHNWSEGALSGKRVFESSVLLELETPDPRWADYVLGRRMICDMRRRSLWEDETELLRRLDSLQTKEKSEMLASLEARNASVPSVAGWEKEREVFLSGTGDKALLRDGSVLEGQIVMEQADRYQWRKMDGSTVWLSKPEIKLIRRGLGVAPGLGKSALSSTELVKPTTVVFLPSSAFGPDLVKGVKNAQKSIFITSYNTSEGLYGPLAEFQNILKQKAKEGVEVVLIAEFGPGTSAYLKRDVLDFASTLTADGIQVKFMQNYKVLHKKLVVVDGQTVWLGSSNLTMAGMGISNESNVRIQDPLVAGQAADDFRRLLEIAKPMSELNY